MFVRLLMGFCLAAGLAATSIQAQIPGRNVNMVSGVTLPDGDPYLQRQNEPSIAASTRNPLHLLAGSNDYRSVDIPGLCLETDPVTSACTKHESEIGDAWLGIYRSTDGGERWNSTLLPGYPQEPAGEGLDPQGNKSPLKIGAYGAAADPVVRAGTNGLLYYTGLAFDRTENGKSAIFMARYIDNNNREDRDAIQYLGTSVIATAATGTGVFLDKPWMAVDIPRGGNPGMCRIVTPGDRNVSRNADGTVTVTQDPPVEQNLPAGTVYVSYTAFSDHPSGERRSAIYLTRSYDCGATWQAPMKVSRDDDPSNQGSTISIDPKNGHVYVAWRRFSAASAPNRDGIMVAKLPTGGRKFNTPGLARRFPQGKKNGLNPERFEKPSQEVAEVSQFDQSTTPFSFRTNAHPTMTIDGEGRVYLAWSERGFAAARPSPVSGDARIVMVTTTDGTTFTPPAPVDDVPQSTDHTTYTMLQGHQVMPSLTFAGGKLMLIYYDLRETKAELFNRFIEDQSGGNSILRHTIDIRSVLGTPGATPRFANSVKVSEYLQGFHKKLGPSRQQLQFNPPNLPMFKLGTAPFMGDYIDVAAAPAFVPTGKGRWAFNTAATNTLPVFHAVWTDNRDVRAPRVDTNGDKNPWNDYTPVRVSSGLTAPNGKAQWINNPVCEAGNTGSRNQNIYTSRITGGLRVGSPGNAKPLSTTVQRGFVVFAQNDTAKTRTFQLTILNQPPGGRASFDQFPIPPYTSATPAPRTVLDVRVAARSTASRTVYITSSDPSASVSVDIKEVNYLVGEVPLDGRVTLNPDIENPDIENPDIENPDIENPDIENPDIENAEVYNPDIENPDIENPDIENPDIENPDIENPDIENPDIENPDIENVVIANPDIENPDIENPDIENPDIENPDIENPDIENVAVGGDGVLTDITWNITNTGNTSAAFNVNLFLAQTNLPQGLKSQLILYKAYRTPVANTVNGTCVLAYQTRKSIVANIASPDFVTANQAGVPDQNDPSEKNATLWLGPGEIGKITLRVYDPDRSNNTTVQVEQADGTFKPVSVDPAFVPSEDVTPVVQQQGVNTEDAQAGVTEAPIVPPPPPLATDDGAWTAARTPVTINVLGNDAALFGSTKIISAHPAGLAQNMGGGANELVYMPTTGLLYAGSGRTVGIIDPVTNHLVGRMPIDSSDPPATYGLGSPSTGLVFFRMGTAGQPNASLYAYDARAASGTLHQVFQINPLLGAAIDALGNAFTFTLDTTGKTLFYVAGNLVQGIGGSASSTLSAINADPASPGVGSILWTLPMPANVVVYHVAQNPVTNKIYLAATNQGSLNGGVYMMNPATPAVPPVKIAGTDPSHALAINPATNLVFAAGVNVGNYRLNAIDGATDTLLSQTSVPGSGFARTFNAEDRLVVHFSSGKVYLRTGQQVVVFDGLKGSPSFTTVVASLPVGPDFVHVDMVVNQSTGMVATAGNFSHSLSLIDVASNAVTAVPLARASGELAVDPTSTTLFAADYLNSVYRVDTSIPSVLGALSVFPETAQVVANPAFNRAYVGMANELSTVSSVSGSGLVASVTGLAPQKGRWGFGARRHATNTFFFANSGSDVTGTMSRPGALAMIDGSNDSVITVVPTIGQPFGVGVNQATAQVFVAGFNGVDASGTLEVGRIRVHDATNPATFIDATTALVVPSSPANPTAIAFGRHVVTNPDTNETYILVTSGSNTSVVYLGPATFAPAPAAPNAQPITLPAAFGTVSFSAADRVEVIRTKVLSPGNSRVYLGTFNSNTNQYKVAVLDGTSHAVIGAYAGGGHSRQHTANWLEVNPTADLVYVVDYNADNVRMLDGTSLTPLVTTVLPEGPSATAFNASQNRLYVSSVDSKTITAIDGASLVVMSSIQLPLHAFFMAVNEPEGRIYTSGGNSPDESGVMVISDVAGQLGAPVNVTSATSGGGTTTVNADNSITYTPGPTTVGTDTFTYTARTAAGDSTATVTVNIVPVAANPVAFSDAYATAPGVTLNVGGRGVLANDAVSNAATASQVAGLPGLTLNADGSFVYAPTGAGTFQFQYLAIDGANSNVAAVTINVIAPPNPLLVVNTAGTGPGSLRAAMDYANATAGAQTITFAIPAVTIASPGVINLQTPLPLITESVTIDGLTQSNGGLPLIEVTNNGGGSIPIGFETSTDVNSVTIRGLAITRFTSHGIRLMQADSSADGTGHVIEANYIGTDRNGTTGKGNAIGIEVRRDDAQILNNVIAGNTGPGILVTNDTDDAVIVGNLIGVSPVTGLALANNAGIRMYDYGSGVVIDSNVIAGNTVVGIDIQNNRPFGVPGVTGTRIIGNTIGLNLSGARVANGTAGVRIDNGPNTRVGEPGLGNVISGNNGAGVRFTGAPSPGARIQGNLIGTDADGDAPLGNTGPGVAVSVSGIDVGWTPGDGPDAANVISGNGGDGVQLLGANNRVRGNLIGTNKAGTAALGSDVGTPSATLSNFQAIYITGAGNVVGGGLAAERNILSGNRINGVYIHTADGNNNTIAGNYIGTDQSGATRVPNGWDGVGLIALPASAVTANSVVNNVISGNTLRGFYITSSGNTIDGNRIGLPPIGVTATGPLGNLGGGVVSPSGTGNRIMANAINNNTGLGIDLAGGGVTVNNPTDGILDFPTLSNAHNGGPTTVVDYSLPQTSFTPGGYTLRFYSSPTCDVSGYGEGETLRHVVNAAGGSAATATFATVVPTGHAITVTAEDAAGNTSEFSACATVAPSSGVEVGGTVRYSGTLMQGVTIKLVQGAAPTGPPLATTITNADGNYAFPGVAPGTYWIRADGPDPSFVGWGASQITVAGVNVVWNLALAKIITLSTPANFATGVASQPTLTWAANAEAASYVIQINKTAGWVPVDPGATSATNQYTVVTALTGGEQYTWQVDAYDGNNRHVGSTVTPFRFTVVVPANTVTAAIGGTGGATAFGPHYCPGGASGVGFRVATNDTPVNDPWGGVSYALTAAEVICNNGSSTTKFGGAPIPNTDLACAPGDVMVGMVGSLAYPYGPDPVVGGLAPRCQSPLGGAITEPWAPRPSGFSNAGPIDCPAGQVVKGVQGGQGAVLDRVQLVCGTP